MIIRRAELKDKKDILEITNLLYLNVPDFVWNTDEFVERQIKGQGYYVVEKQGRIAGIVSFRERNNRMHIETLAVANDYQSEGVGAKLIDFAKEFTREKGLATLRVYSFYEYKTVDFYLRQGFSLLLGLGKYNGHKYYRFEMRA